MRMATLDVLKKYLSLTLNIQSLLFCLKYGRGEFVCEFWSIANAFYLMAWKPKEVGGTSQRKIVPTEIDSLTP